MGQQEQGRRRIKVLVREEDWDQVMGQGLRGSWLMPEGEDTEGQGISSGHLGQSEEDVEGQVYVLRVPEPGEQIDDAEGQSYKLNGIGQSEEDVEGQGSCYGKLVPAGPDDVEGQGIKCGWLRETDEGWILEAEDDTQGQGGYYRGVRAEEPDDAEGHRGSGRPPVDR